MSEKNEEIPKKGESVPDFDALICDGEVFHDANLLEVMRPRGCVLVFYGFCFSAVAKNWWKRYDRKGWDEFEKVSVVGVGRDGPYAQNAFLRSINSPFRTFSDVDGGVAEAFGLLKKRNGMANASTARRSIFVLDSDRKVVYRWVSDDQITPPPADEVEAAVSRL